MMTRPNESGYSEEILMFEQQDEVVNCEDPRQFDPDILEHNLDKRNELSRYELDVEDIQEVIVVRHFQYLLFNYINIHFYNPYLNVASKIQGKPILYISDKTWSLVASSS